MKLPKGPPRGRLGLYVAQSPATREAGTLGVACGCACGGRGAARGGKGGRIANSFPLARGSKSAVVLALVLVWPRGPPRGRGQPRGRLGLYVAQKPATREAHGPAARDAGALLVVVVMVVVQRGEAREVG